ncbi:MAG TPA: FHA domain-containing protein, partial [Myxococcota bacterium]
MNDDKNNPTQPPVGASVPPTEVSSTRASPGAPVHEERTQPFRLKDMAPRLAQRRRRTFAAELTFKRGRTDVRIPLDRSETVIGRDPTCDIVLADKPVSARHARVRRSAGGYFELEDLASTNGTLVD